MKVVCSNKNAHCRPGEADLTLKCEVLSLESKVLGSLAGGKIPKCHVATTKGSSNHFGYLSKKQNER